MGGCVSSSSRSSCSSGSNGESAPPQYACGLCRKKRTKRTYSERHAALQHLPSLPNRILMNGKSRSSCIFTQQGRKGINQDAMIVWEEFMEEDTIFCGVFDGHGPFGHLVAQKVRDVLPIKLQASWRSSQSRQKESARACFNGNARMQETCCSNEEEVLEALPNSLTLWREAFLKSYKAMDKELKSRPSLDCFCSGSTAVTMVKQGSNLFMGYIGDSRAVLGSKDTGDSMVAVQLSVDMKPDLPREAERIKRCKGRVFALQDEPEVPRVWLPFDDAPGLAMARAFGDFCLKEYGVISIPEFSHRVLTDKDQFVVLASDGVWDVLSNEEVVQIVASAPTRSSAARILIEAAAREWKLKYPTSKMDDCAVVCLFLDGKMDLESDDEEQGYCSASIQANVCSNALESEEGPKSEPTLQRNFTVRSGDEDDVYGRISGGMEGSGVAAVGKADDQGWYGLEGVTRVNSLVQLPRFPEERHDM
ncbi:hypothetical protein MLD38_025844 [Melastoma candidum]|uniref:Uncharacterized protein n=1 Tax=Melastoma candidum TaxID=119954 RepID=A0ACB9NZU6_9MYRT|nr:hypothetical protein MLD38_025844 [Melastoma candidum]